MAVGYATPVGVAQDIDTLATAIAAKPAISAAVEVADVPDVEFGRKAVKVTGTAVKDVDAAIRMNVRNVDAGTATSGNFTLTVDGQTTANIAYNAAASAVKSALELLSTVSTVTVTGTGAVADPWIVTFAELQARTTSGNGAGLVGGTGLTVSSPVANCTILEGTSAA